MVKFLNLNDDFDLLLADSVELWHWGKANMDWHQVFESCREGVFPQDIRGRFAFFYRDKNNVFMCVNHVAEKPLYYTEDRCFAYLNRWVLDTELEKNDAVHEAQLGLLGFCYTIGEHTPYEQIRRVKPEHYYHNGVQYRYSDVSRPRGYIWDDELYRHLLNSSLERELATQMQASMLFSSGRDSAVIASALAQTQLNRKVDFYTIYHESGTHNEVDDAMSNAYQLDIAPVELRANVTRPLDAGYEFNDSAWHVKYQTLSRYNIDGLIITGEVGNCMSYGETGKRLNYFTNCYGKIKPEEIASMICSHVENFKQTCTNTSTFSDQFLRDSVHAPVAWQMIVDDVADDLNRWGFHYSKDLDYKRNCIINAGSLHHKVFRLRGYSQDTGRQYFHPLADYYVMEYTLGLSWFEREQHDTAKWYYQRAYQQSGPFAIAAWNNNVRGLGIKCQ